MIKRILLLTDGSKVSKKAFPYAEELCRQFGAKLFILIVNELYPHMTERRSLDTMYHQAVETIEKDLRKKVAEYVNDSEFRNIQCTGEVRTGEPSQQIIAYAEEIDADMIVVASHGRTGLSHILLGSVAERISRYAPCPVLIVRARKES